MSNTSVIELTLPGQVQFCEMARRVVMECCKLIRQSDEGDPEDTQRPPRLPSERYEFNDSFTVEFVSAFSEIFNNIALHAYKGRGTGTVACTITLGQDALQIDMRDTGSSFDIDAVPPPGDLPTGGMGLFLARSMLDELHYQAGPPNHWRLVKKLAICTSARSESAESA